MTTAAKRPIRIHSFSIAILSNFFVVRPRDREKAT